MSESSEKHTPRPSSNNPNLARDHLANERTFLAWVRTGLAGVAFGFGNVGFAEAVPPWVQIKGRVAPSSGLSVWFGAATMIAGVLVCVAGLIRYRRTREQIESGMFQPAGFIIDLVGITTALLGVGLAAYLIYIEVHF
jgi:putative membrane protein